MKFSYLFILLLLFFLPTSVFATTDTFNATLAICYPNTTGVLWDWYVSTGYSTNSCGGTPQQFQLRSSNGYSGYYDHLWRLRMTFDTSSLPDDAVINSAFISYRGYRLSNGVLIPSVIFVDIQESETDFNLYWPHNSHAISDSFDRFDFYANPNYVNLTDLSGIDVTGNSVFGVMNTDAFYNNTPTWQDNIYDYWVQTGTTYLSVTYNESSPTPTPTADLSMVSFGSESSTAISDYVAVKFVFAGLILFAIGTALGVVLLKR